MAASPVTQGSEKPPRHPALTRRVRLRPGPRPQRQRRALEGPEQTGDHLCQGLAFAARSNRGGGTITKRLNPAAAQTWRLQRHRRTSRPINRFAKTSDNPSPLPGPQIQRHRRKGRMHWSQSTRFSRPAAIMRYRPPRAAPIGERWQCRNGGLEQSGPSKSVFTSAARSRIADQAEKSE